MRIVTSILLFSFGFLSHIVAQVPTPTPKQTKNILLMNGIAHLGDGKVIENSAIAFENGKFTIVADATVIRIDASKFDTVINISGKHVYPGFIAPNSRLGLVEIDAVKATRDQDEIGEMNPNIRAIIAYNTDSKITPTVRFNGILLAQITPQGGVISGSSSIVQLDAWNWEDALIKEDDGIHLNWPKMFNQTGWWAEPGEFKKNEKYKEFTQKIDAFFTEALAYSKTEPQEKNLKYEAIKKVFSGQRTLYIHSDYVKEMQEAINFVRKFNLKKVAIVGGYDSWMLTDQLKENNISVMLRRVHDLPVRPEDDVNLPYKMPKILVDAGVMICLENSGDMEAMGTRNLPFYAGTAATYGLSKEEALKLVTLNTATILGIDKNYGSIQTGKSATFFVSDGDALNMTMNNVVLAYIDGRMIELTNHQLQLYEKFKSK